MIVSANTIHISSPPDQVYDFLMDPANYPMWQAGLQRIEATNGMAVDSIITFTSIGMGRTFNLKAKVTRNDGASTFTAVSQQGPITFESTYKLEPDPAGGTRLTLTGQIETHSLFKLAEPVLQTMSENKSEGDLKNLKTLIEAH